MNVGLDIGYYATKVVAGQNQVGFFPSVAAPGRELIDTGFSDPRPKWLLLHPYRYFVGKLAVDQGVGRRTLDRDWFKSQQWEALFYTALASVTIATHASINLVVGVPVTSRSYSGVIKNMLEGEHQIQVRGRRKQTLRVEKTTVVLQGIGVLLNEVLATNGGLLWEEKDLEKRTGIIDIGGGTTNYVSLRGLQAVSRETGTIEVGAWQVEREVRAALGQMYPGLMERMSSHDLIRDIEKGWVKYRGDETCIAPVTKPIIAHIGQQIVNELSSTWGSGSDLENVYLAGGGAHIFGESLKEVYPQLTIVPSATWANAYGYWKLAERLERMG